jgi:glucose/arabinose dehydrogenase
MGTAKIWAFLGVAIVGFSDAACAEGDASRGARLFGEQCTLCHTSEGNGGQGPNLRGVFGRKPAASDFGYSAALTSAGWIWNDSRLDHYLENPAAAAPGTAMRYAVTDKQERVDLIAYLRTLTGPAANAPAQLAPSVSNTPVFGDWHADRPGLRHRITIADLPAPYETPSAGNPPRLAPRSTNAKPQAPEGFAVDLFAQGLSDPRTVRSAPNGDLFVAEMAAGRIRVLRPSADGKSAAKNAVYASGLSGPFGIAFYPQGQEPKWVYVAENNRVLRFPYRPGDLAAAAKPEVIVAQLAPTSGGHATRDVAFSKDGARMFVSVGSGSNVAQGMPRKSPEEIKAWEAKRGLGAAWGSEDNRADVLVFTPDGKDARIFATGLRNCVGLTVHPRTDDVYCSTNERDGLGDNLVPDYVTRVREGAFYGWPWWYMGNREDPRWKGARPDLSGKVTAPDVPLQPHSAPLGMTFYTGNTFPADYRDSAFAAFHGSWNRTARTGYKVVRVLMRDGVPTGEYEDFLTGFVVDDNRVWGRPVGVATGKDGSLFVSEDASGTIWRVSYGLAN